MGLGLMIKLELKHGLPFCEVMLGYKGRTIGLTNVLVDTGSGGSVFKMEKIEELGITIEIDDVIETISGIGGSEFVYRKNVDRLKLGDSEVFGFTIEVGVMNYGFDINGILGMDFLQLVGAKIDLAKLEIST